MIKKNFKRVALISMSMLMLIGVTACGNKKMSEREEYESLKAEATFEVGTEQVTQDSFADKLKEFAKKVYEPTSETDMREGIESIKDYCTEQVYTDMVNSIVYAENSDWKISNIDVNKITNSNTNLNITKEIVNIERTVKTSDKTYGVEHILIEFGINPNNRIYSYKIWHYTDSLNY